MDSCYWCQLYYSVSTHNNGLKLLVSSLPFSHHTEQLILDIGVNSTIQFAHKTMDSSYWCQVYHSVCTKNNGLQLLVSTLPFSLHTEQWTGQLLVSTLPFSLLTEQWTPAIGVNSTIQSAHRTMDSSYWCQLYHSVCIQNNGLQQWTPAVNVNSTIQSAHKTMDTSFQLLVSTLPVILYRDKWTPLIGVNFSFQSANRTMDTSYWCQLYHSTNTQNNGHRLLVSTLQFSLHTEQWTPAIVSTLPFSLHIEQWTPAINVNSTIQSAMDTNYWCQLYHSTYTQNNGHQLLVSRLPLSQNTEQWILAIGVNLTIQFAHKTMDSSYWYHSVCTQNNGNQLLVSTLPFNLHTEQWILDIGVNFTIQSAHRTIDSSYWCQLYHSASTQNNGLQLKVSTLPFSQHTEQ